MNKITRVKGTQSEASVLLFVFEVASSYSDFTITIIVVCRSKG